MDMTKEELNEVLKRHKMWLNKEEGGKRAYLKRTNLSYADMIGADLKRAALPRANLYFTDLRRARLEEADLSSTTLVNALLIDADLRGADLQGANLQGANLQGANLAYADLSGAKMCQEDMDKTSLTKEQRDSIRLYKNNPRRKGKTSPKAMTYEDIKRGQVFSLRLKAKTKRKDVVILDMILPGTEKETLRWPKALCKFLIPEKDNNHTQDDEQTHHQAAGKSPENLD